MKAIHIFCVGRLNQVYRDLADDYFNRIKRFCSLKIVEIPEPRGNWRNSQLSRQQSSKLVLEKLQARPFCLLDRTGQGLTSLEFSSFLQNELELGEISFVIGAFDGVSDELRARARKRISFSDLTFPHQLFRVMLLEQIYRGFAIINHLPYHAL